MRARLFREDRAPNPLGWILDGHSHVFNNQGPDLAATVMDHFKESFKRMRSRYEIRKDRFPDREHPFGASCSGRQGHICRTVLASIVLLFLLGACAGAPVPAEESEPLPAGEERIDAPPSSGKVASAEPTTAPPPDPSDPTRIDARAGAGYKYTDFTDGAILNEFRAKLALMIGKTGTFVADIGVGRINNHPTEGDETGLTDGRFRYFHLFSMDLKKMGYRGFGASAEIQTQGTVPGTDGSNLLAVGGLWSFAITDNLSFFPNLIGSASWSKNLDDFLGYSVRGDLFLTWKPSGIWDGAYLKVKPSYTCGLSGDLAGDDNFSVETAVGGTITKDKKWWWDIQGRSFFATELDEERQGIAQDWSLYFSVTYFF